MASMDLKQSLIRDLDILLADKATAERVQKYFRRLKKQIARSSDEKMDSPCRYSVEELEQEIDKSLEDINSGQTVSQEEMHRFLNKYC